MAVVAEQCSAYSYVPFLWAALVALFVPWPLIHFTWLPMQTVFLLQLIVFMVIIALLWGPSARLALIPKRVLNENAHRRAAEQFLVQNLHTTAGRTGVLIFVSVAERHAEVLADNAIDGKVPAGTWQAIVDRLTRDIGQGRAADGLVHAIERIGELLAQHFPPGSNDPNELPDHLILLDG